MTDPYPPLRDVMDKQGCYLWRKKPWPSGGELKWNLRGLSVHDSRAEAEASLA